MALHIPTVTEHDLRQFHAQHFPNSHLPAKLIHSTEAHHEDGYIGYDNADDDGLGYYNDGVKRTLTDVQVAIFRHSEIQAIIRQRTRRREQEQDGSVEVSPKRKARPTRVELVPTDPKAPSIDWPDPTTTTSTSPRSSLSKTQTDPTTSLPSENPRKISKGRRAKNRKKNRVAHRARKKEQLRNGNGQGQNSRAGNTRGQGGDDDDDDDDDESDEWDPWHQANGPDAQKDTTVDLQY